MNYWERKRELSVKAVRHTDEMEAAYSREIKDAINKTITYSEDDLLPEIVDMGNRPRISVIASDSTGAVLSHSKGKTAVLNFASYKNPGGMFINGSSAQEESLCHASFLYNVLKEKTEYYEWNNRFKNKCMYKNRALYSPNIMFMSQDSTIKKSCNVITCAAPNIKAGREYCNVSEIINTKYLKSRIRFILRIAEEQQVDTLILGAWGCGVFGQDPEEVATLFKEELSMGYTFKHVVFAILPGENLDTFKRVFK